MAVKDWSTTAASNTGIISGMSLDGSVMAVNQTDNAFRDFAAQIASQLGKMGFEGADIASASTTNLANATGWSLDITGTTTITAFGTVDAGQVFFLRFAGALTLTHNSTSLILPGAANITTAAGDVAIMKSEGSGNWRCLAYTKASGRAVVTGLPSSSTDNAAARYDGTSGAFQDSGVLIDDSNNLSGIGNISLSGTLTYSNSNFGFVANTSDASDTKSMFMAGGGSFSTSRGALVVAYGAEHASFGGYIRLLPSSPGIVEVTGNMTINGTLTVTG